MSLTEDKIVVGIVVMIGAQFLLTGTDVSAKWLALAGVPALQIAFIRYLVHFAISASYYLPRAGRVAFRSNNPAREIARSICLVFITVFNFVALKFLPISVTTTISFATPLVVTILAIPLLDERVSVTQVGAVALGFLGVLVVVQPWGNSLHPAIFLSLCVLLCSSVYFLLTRSLAGTDSNATMQLWSSGIATVVLFPAAMAVWVWPNGIQVWLILGAIGFFGGTGHTLVATAHRFAKASTLAPVIYIQIFFATAAGAIVFSAMPTASTILGAAIIVASGAIGWRQMTFPSQGTAIRQAKPDGA
ncbi:EamA family transporter [Sinorhizobium meliloti]|nr:EamA family transporter [Sinorhizobium meliloti]MDX0384556.1 EamA family transporter [Sinorhizobium meliloti]